MNCNIAQKGDRVACIAKKTLLVGQHRQYSTVNRIARVSAIGRWVC
jgi:hypothetical protein